MHNLLSTAQTAEVLETSERMVHYFVRDGRLSPADRLGRNLLFDPMEVALLKPTLSRRNWSKQVSS